MNKAIIFICFLIICAIILLGVINKRSIEDIALALMVTFILAGVSWLFKRLMQ